MTLAVCLGVAMLLGACGGADRNSAGGDTAAVNTTTTKKAQTTQDPSSMLGMLRGTEYFFKSEPSPSALAERATVVVRGTIDGYQRRGVISYPSTPGRLGANTMGVRVSEVLKGRLSAGLTTINVDFEGDLKTDYYTSVTPKSATTVLYLMPGTVTPNGVYLGSKFEADTGYVRSGPSFRLWSPQGFLVGDPQDGDVVLPFANAEFSDTSLADVEPDAKSDFPQQETADHHSGAVQPGSGDDQSRR